MIESFSHKGLQALFEEGSKRGVVPHLAPRLLDILDILNAATSVEDVRSPNLRLHPWKGGSGIWSVNVTGNWRIVFRFRDGAACDVDLVDPH